MLKVLLLQGSMVGQRILEIPIIFAPNEVGCLLPALTDKLEPATGFEPVKIARLITNQFLLTTQENRQENRPTLVLVVQKWEIHL